MHTHSCRMGGCGLLKLVNVPIGRLCVYGGGNRVSSSCYLFCPQLKCPWTPTSALCCKQLCLRKNYNKVHELRSSGAKNAANPDDRICSKLMLQSVHSLLCNVHPDLPAVHMWAIYKQVLAASPCHLRAVGRSHRDSHRRRDCSTRTAMAMLKPHLHLPLPRQSPNHLPPPKTR
jgi:hypothetical protein